MKKPLSVFLIIFLIQLVSCTHENQETDLKFNDEHPSALINTWIESNEEGRDIFRPKDYMDFPVARYRQSYELKANHEVVYSRVMPADGVSYVEAQWAFNASANSIRIYDSVNTHFYLNIIQLESDLLTMSLNAE